MGGGGSATRRPQQQQQQPTFGGSPLQGLQSAQPRQTMYGGGGTPGRSGGAPDQMSRLQATNAALANASNDSRWAAHYNAMGRRVVPVGTPPMPVSYDNNGRAIYGWGPNGPNYTPTINYAEVDEGGGGGGGGRGPSGPSGPSGPMGGLIDAMPQLPKVAPIAPIDDSEAVRAAYGRAKDTAGMQGRAAMDSLMDMQGARGIVGSGLGLNEAGGVIAEGARQLGDVNRDIAERQVENERWRQGTNYQGEIGQRGQDQNWWEMELRRRMYNAGNSPTGHVQGSGVNPIPGFPKY